MAKPKAYSQRTVCPICLETRQHRPGEERAKVVSPKNQRRQTFNSQLAPPCSAVQQY